MSEQPPVLFYRHENGAEIRTHEGSDLAALIREEDGWSLADPDSPPTPEKPEPEPEPVSEPDSASEPTKAPEKKAPAKKAPAKKAAPKPGDST